MVSVVEWGHTAIKILIGTPQSVESGAGHTAKCCGMGTLLSVVERAHCPVLWNGAHC